ncbi:MAG: aminopeptidase [Pseudomonadota bacterium]
MLTDTHLNRYADTLLWGLKTARTNPFRKQEMVLIRYDSLALPLAEILYARILEMGLNPVQRCTLTPRMEKSFYQLSNSRQLTFQPPGEREFYESLGGSIYLHAPESITHLSEADPKKIGRAAVARKFIRDILNKREEMGNFGWTLCMLPTIELARHADLSIDEYTRQIVNACFLDHASPVSEWQSIYEQSRAIKTWLNHLDVQIFHIESTHVDLKITPGDQRKWIGITGHNIPSFELFISPDWRGTQGVYFANQPSYRNGNFVENVRLEFKDGVAIKIGAQKGESFVKNQLAMDKGASRLGEFSLTDKRFSKIDRFMANTLFDENFGGPNGNCHVALGSSYTDTYSGNSAELTEKLKKKLGFNDSALHWDLVNTEQKRVSAHLKTGEKISIYEDGRFTC